MNPLEVSQLYFKLSNQADLSAIRDLFHPDASYQSEQTGMFHGVNKIMTMMARYFSNHKNLSWEINQIKSISEHEVAIDFTGHKTHQNGEPQTVHGTENILVVNGLIRRIEVHYPNP